MLEVARFFSVDGSYPLNGLVLIVLVESDFIIPKKDFKKTNELQTILDFIKVVVLFQKVFWYILVFQIPPN